MRFEANWRCYSTRYCGGLVGLGIMLLFVTIRPMTDDQLTSKLLFDTMFLKDIRVVGLLLGICLYGQIICYFCSNTLTKLLTIEEDKAIFHFFNNKVHEFKYSDLSSLDYTNDLYKIFLFTFKDGKKQKISSSVKNHKMASEIIRKKIAEAHDR